MNFHFANILQVGGYCNDFLRRHVGNDADAETSSHEFSSQLATPLIRRDKRQNVIASEAKCHGHFVGIRLCRSLCFETSSKVHV